MIILYLEKWDMLSIYYYRGRDLFCIDIFDEENFSDSMSALRDFKDVRKFYSDEIIHDDNL
jgi:hypothetical protein